MVDIIVVNKKDNLHNGQPYKIYIGRPSILENPYSVEEHGRAKCISMYARHFRSIMDGTFRGQDYHAIRAAVHWLIKVHKQYGRLVLECWCKPEACHGDVIKDYLSHLIELEEMLS